MNCLHHLLVIQNSFYLVNLTSTTKFSKNDYWNLTASSSVDTCCKHKIVTQFILTISFHQNNFNIQLSLYLSGTQQTFSGWTFIQGFH